jgi:RNA polymerase sigma-70 factor (ECF subfamily)
MEPESSFQDLIRRVRAGDPDAAAELVREYEPAIRRAVRVRLTDSRLRSALDSMDVCQSVLANFFVRAAAGQFDLDEPGQLLRLLAHMARNRLLDHVRHEQAGRRDRRRVQAGDSPALAGVADRGETPSQLVAGRELLEVFRRQLSEQERLLADQRAQGRAWADIAAEVGGSPEALRKQMERAIERVARQMGLEEAAAG